MPGCSATSLESTSPTVAPSTLTTLAPPAWLRRTVGRRTSTATGPPRSVLWVSVLNQMISQKSWPDRLLTDSVTILQAGRRAEVQAGHLEAGYLDLLLGDPPVHDAVAAHDRVGVAQRDEDVEPTRVGGLGHVGRRGVRVRVGVRVEDAHDVGAELPGRPVDPEHVLGVDL